MVDVGRLPDRGGPRKQRREKEEMKARATHVSPVVSSRWLRKENEKEKYLTKKNEKYKKKINRKKTSSKKFGDGRLPDRGGLRNQHREKEEMKARATHVSPVGSSRWLRKENKKKIYILG